MTFEDLSDAEFEQKISEKWPPERVRYVARGLGRSTTVNRTPDGLPITERAAEIEELMRINEERIRRQKLGEGN